MYSKYGKQFFVMFSKLHNMEIIFLLGPSITFMYILIFGVLDRRQEDKIF
jgi:hypothetical protein